MVVSLCSVVDSFREIRITSMLFEDLLNEKEFPKRIPKPSKQELER